jgi:hypothetical protein
MAKAKEPTKASVEALIAELNSFVDNFKVEDPEDVQIRKDAVITAMDNAGLLSVKGSLRWLRFQQAIEGFTPQLPKREELARQAETFDDLTNRYADEPPVEDMKDALEILKVIRNALLPVVQDELKKLT